MYCIYSSQNRFPELFESSSRIDPPVGNILGRPVSWLCASLLAAASPLLVTSVAASHLLEIIENGESPTPIVTYDGNPLTLPGGNFLKDNWSINLPDGFFLFIQGKTKIGEPEDSTKYNQIVFASDTDIIWLSDIPKPDFMGSLPSTMTLIDVGTFTPTAGGPAQTFDLRLVDQIGSQIPDSWSTATLLGLTFLGLMGCVRIRSCPTD